MTVVSHALSTKSSGAYTLKINVTRNGTDKIIFYFNMFAKLLTGAFIYLFKLIGSIPSPSWDTLWVWDLRTFRRTPSRSNTMPSMRCSFARSLPFP